MTIPQVFATASRKLVFFRTAEFNHTRISMRLLRKSRARLSFGIKSDLVTDYLLREPNHLIKAGWGKLIHNSLTFIFIIISFIFYHTNHIIQFNQTCNYLNSPVTFHSNPNQFQLSKIKKFKLNSKFPDFF